MKDLRRAHEGFRRAHEGEETAAMLSLLAMLQQE
jgi:hypothetical protein